MNSQSLSGQVALVAGATRGCGRAIAVALGALGATVYGSGRTTRSERSPMDRPETIEETAERVDAAGGHGVAVRCDHSDPTDVAALLARIAAEQDGRLDVLVNDVWGGDPLVHWGSPVWDHSLGDGLSVWRNAIETHLITSHHALGLMAARGSGLVVEVGDGKAGVPFRGNLYYDLVKETIPRLALGLAAELAPHGVDAVAVTPGFLRSEAMLEHFGVGEETWRDAVESSPWFAYSETPALLGRGVAALAADPQRRRFRGQCLGSWDLMHEYDLADADGTRPDWGAVDGEARAAYTMGPPDATS